MLRLSDYLIIGAGVISLGLSVYLWFNGQQDEGVFVGLWVPSILAFGAFLRSGRTRSAS